MSNDDGMDAGGPFERNEGHAIWPRTYEERAREIALRAAEWTVHRYIEEQRQKADAEIARLMRKAMEADDEILEQVDVALAAATERLDVRRADERLTTPEVRLPGEEPRRSPGTPKLGLVDNRIPAIYFEEFEYAEDVARALIEEEGRRIIQVREVASRTASGNRAFELVLGDPE